MIRKALFLIAWLCTPTVRAQITPAPPRYTGVQYTGVAANPIQAGQYGMYYDTTFNQLRLHNNDNTYTQLGPGWSQSSGLGTWQMQIQMDGADALQNYLLRYTHPVDATGTNRGPWNFVCTSNVEPPTAQLTNGYTDTTCQWGWNGGGGGAYLSGQPAAYWQGEQFFVQGGVWQMENEFIYQHPVSGQWRPFVVNSHICDEATPGDCPTGAAGGGVSMYLDATAITMGIGQNNNAPARLEIASDTTRTFSPNHLALFQLTDGSAVMADTWRTNPASITANSSSSGNGTLSIVGDVSPNADDTYDGGNISGQRAWRNWYVRRAIGGCNTLANRPSCAIGILTEGARYSVCAVQGVSNGAEYVCHCASNGTCNWQ